MSEKKINTICIRVPSTMNFTHTGRLCSVLAHFIAENPDAVVKLGWEQHYGQNMSTLHNNSFIPSLSISAANNCANGIQQLMQTSSMLVSQLEGKTAIPPVRTLDAKSTQTEISAQAHQRAFDLVCDLRAKYAPPNLGYT